MNSPDTQAGGKRAGAARTPRTPRAAVTARAAPRRGKAASIPPISADERRRMIEVCAYFLAQQRGFAPGGDQQDWLDAEARIDLMLTTVPGKQSGSTAP